jgi:hypothetical protein
MADALGDVVGRPYREGVAGRLSFLGKALTAVGASVIALFGRRRVAAIAGGASVATGAALSRFAVFHAGVQSAADPEFTVGPQKGAQSRSGLGRS